MATTFNWTICCLLCETPKQSEEGKLPEYAISLVNKCLAVEIYAFQKSCWSYNPWGPVLRDIG